MSKKHCKEKLKSNRESEKALKLKDALATLQSEKDCLSVLLTNFIFDSLYQCAAQGINLITNHGEDGFERWITDKRNSIDFSSEFNRRTLLTVFFLMTPSLMTSERVSEIIDKTPLK